MKYLLTFKPLKHFFFGNNKTFSDDYVAKSEYFAQNTQLLGAIRLFIAEQNNLMHIHKNGKYSNNPDKLKKLIGTASTKDFTTNDDLGIIQNLSQMFIVNTQLDDAYFPTPFDIEVKDDSIRQYTLTSIDDDYFLSDYDVKNSSYQKLANGCFWDRYINNLSLDNILLKDFDDIFISHSQVGIELDKKQVVVDEKGNGKFYSKIDYTLRDGFLFGCVIDLDEDIIKDGIINIGAESSLFKLSITPLKNTQLKEHIIIKTMFDHTIKATNKSIAISEVMINNPKDIKSDFSLVPFYKNFANLKYEDYNTGKKTYNNKDIIQYRNFKGKTAQKRLIPNGSVFYNVKNQTIKPTGAYAKMGYNQIINIGEQNV